MDGEFAARMVLFILIFIPLLFVICIFGAIAYDGSDVGHETIEIDGVKYISESGVNEEIYVNGETYVREDLHDNNKSKNEKYVNYFINGIFMFLGFVLVLSGYWIFTTDISE